MLVRLPELLLFAEDLWRKARDTLAPAPAPTAAQSKMPTLWCPPATAPKSGAQASETSATMAVSTPTTTTTTTTTTTASVPSQQQQQPSGSGAGAAGVTKKRCWHRKTVHFTVFLAAFSTILSLLWVYTLTAELRRKAFDDNMERDYVLKQLSMDNPELANYIRMFYMQKPEPKEPLNATQTPEEQFIANQLHGKRDGLYFEYMSRVGAASTTAWLESTLGWRGLMIFTDPRNLLDASRSSRNPKTKVVRACLSSDNATKEITYHQEADVQVTKLGEGPNSLVFSKESLPATRLLCFPLYSFLLAYNATTFDYLSLDSTEIQEVPVLTQVLGSIPWDSVRVSVLSIYWSPQHNDAETKTIVDILAARNYKLAKTLTTGKLVFFYNRRLKI